MSRLIALCLLLAGCDDATPKDTGPDTGPAPVDEDGDGFLVSQGDCDDGDPAVNPDATEVCNGIDDDCDALADEDVSTPYWTDADGDGYGDADVPVLACDVPSGAVPNHDDCDDADATVNPDASEVCNGVDDDCSGTTDDGLTAAMYADVDGDGHGDPAAPVDACAEAEGVVAIGDDCDDGDADVHPGAEEADCADPVDYNCDGSVGYADADGDGWAACEECDDGNDAIRPDANERCNAADDDCDGEIDEPGADGAEVWYGDLDGDGFGDPQASEAICEPPQDLVRDATDCDDADAGVNPAADEVCDGVDQDCDGETDEDAGDAPVLYADADGDGFGDPASPLAQCDAPSGYVADATDCDDADAGVFPGADETCDGHDDDCDGDVDENSAVDASVWFYDGDGDGYGNPSSPTLACDAPAGHVSNSEDCEDVDATINPVAPESCNGVDDDCDGDIDEGAAAGSATWYLDADGDGYGNGAVSQDACDAPAGYVADGSDCNDGSGAVSPAGTETCDGIDDDCDGDVDEDGLLTFYKDVDGDGWGDATLTRSACSAPSGYVSTAGDCDDANVSVSPSSAEVCDTVDNDCDGATDEAGGVAFYADTDGDGFGDPTHVTVGCAAPSGYTADATDCDDTTNAIHPGAGETCDGVDEDCDGTADDGAGTPWYRDADGDGYGTSATTSTSCTEPTGYVSNSEDCDDASSGFSPAVAETCSDNLDQDCDGVADDGCPDVIEHCGTISSDETWAGEDVHLVTCDVYVQGSTAPLLTIEDGATVEFAPGAGLYVGVSSYGELWVDGTSAGVTFTSDDSRPSAGDWDGISIYQYDRGSWIEGATIEYGGANGYGDLYLLYANSVTVVDSTITDSSESGVYAAGGGTTLAMSGTTVADNADYGVYLSTTADLYATRGPTFTGNTITGNGAYPVVVPAAYAAQIDDDLVVSGNGTDRVYVYGGTITSDATWLGLDVPYEIGGDVLVEAASGPRLTLADGAELDFASGAGLSIGANNYGELSVEGTTEGVTLTSSRTTKRAGDWDGVDFGTYAQYASVSGATIAYGGGNGYGDVYVRYTYNTDAVYIADSNVSDSSHAGVYVSWYGAVDVQDTTIADSTEYGVYVWDYGELNGDDSCGGNTVTGNGTGVSVPAQEAGAFTSTGHYTGNTGDDFVVRADTIARDTTWHALDAAYRVTGDIVVADATRPVLTVDDGVTAKFDGNAGLFVGSGSYGALDVEGDTTGVTFTSSDSAPAPGDWDGIQFTWYNQDSILRHATVEYGGGNGYGNLYMSPSSYAGGTVLVEDCAIRSSSQSGIYVYESSDVAVSGTTVADNADDGIYMTSGSALDTNGEPSFTDNALTGNGGYPIVIPAPSLDQLDKSSTFTGNGTDLVYVVAGTVASSGTWQDLDAAYDFNGDTWIQGSTTPVVTIEAGATLKFNYYAGLYVGLYNYGKLVADGTPTAPITFTSAQASPLAGDWDGIQTGWDDTGSLFDNVVISYGGYDAADLYLDHNASPATVTDSTITNSYRWGIYRYLTSPTISGVTYASNASGDLY